MTPSRREYYDQQVAWATLKYGLKTEDWFFWYSQHMRPSSIDYPDGMFDSMDEMYEYLGVENPEDPTFE